MQPDVPGPPGSASSRLAWWLIGVVVVCTVIGNFVIPTLAGIAMARAHSAASHHPTREDPDFIDAIDHECSVMHEDLISISTYGADRISEENDAVEEFIGRLHASSTEDGWPIDPATNNWLQDWLHLTAARRQYALQLERDPATPPPAAPQTNGVLLTESINSLHVGCRVPPNITDDFSR